MKLEDEIKQSRFKSEYHKLGVNIIYTANWLSHHHSKQCKEYDITPEQFNILRILRGQYPNPATVNLLIERMLNKMSNVSRLVEKLRKKELVERKISAADRRACDVAITKKGLGLLAELDKAEKEWNKRISHLSEEEAKKVNTILDKLRK
ncbi:MAG: MarR family winged helix-turn-helix transcriptional regulator [Bacteroidia bacterium]